MTALRNQWQRQRLPQPPLQSLQPLPKQLLLLLPPLPNCSPLNREEVEDSTTNWQQSGEEKKMKMKNMTT